jgi:hypothetical protein
MWLSDICKNKYANARFLMKISSFTAVKFILCNIPKLTYSLRLDYQINYIFANLMKLEGISNKDLDTKLIL